MATPKPTKNFPQRPVHPLYEDVYVHTSKEKIDVRHCGISPGSELGSTIPPQARFPGSIITGVRAGVPMTYYYDPELRIYALDKAADVWAWIWANHNPGVGYEWRRIYR